MFTRKCWNCKVRTAWGTMCLDCVRLTRHGRERRPHETQHDGQHEPRDGHERPDIRQRGLGNPFGPFDIDLTADLQRHLCPIWFGPDSPVGEFDALEARWEAHGSNGYSNPPYGPFVQRILAHAKASACTTGFASTLLLPMRVTKAFKAHVLDGAAQLLFCDTRLTFFENGVPRLNEKAWTKEGRAVSDPAMFDSIIVRYRPLTDDDWRGSGVVRCPDVGIWEVPKHVTADDLARAVERRRLIA